MRFCVEKMSFGRPNVVDVNVSGCSFGFGFGRDAFAGDSATAYSRCSITIQAENHVVES